MSLVAWYKKNVNLTKLLISLGVFLLGMSLAMIALGGEIELAPCAAQVLLLCDNVSRNINT